ncbi:cyclopropane-fatty-acyl-phospholipid synthase [Laetiporus sulphureus 93-53]|uniref:Cyclopropane-fatty-acyl-phospholipid synthase n=1 Tax=Laetiporus sulphureus 93-53 TaxID=1314785 RepID=A0A165HMS6_9APHY|nr:cyclopropane-fatty-acyl-phospholipid synthase [Laetiporus sulphureus 93-53]KZT11940.1 cyclopropane-fatty-acyl-phospholipid synthase [Laetiporus sulphureus 93-53]
MGAHSVDWEGLDGEDPAFCVQLIVRNPAFWIRVAMQGDLGFAESYMFGDVDICFGRQGEEGEQGGEALFRFFELLLANRKILDAIDTPLARIGRLPAAAAAKTRLANTLIQAKTNIAAHYDVSNRMFAAFLSRDMTYSCAIFPELDGYVYPYSPSTSTSSSTSASTSKDSPVVSESQSDGLPQSANGSDRGVERNIGRREDKTEVVDEEEDNRDDEELYEAQMRKLQHIIGRADIKRGHRVLEIGTGWGALAITIARTVPDVQVDTITLSEEQAALALERIEIAGLGEQQSKKCKYRPARVRVHLMDYRSLPPAWAGAFDRMVSVEMVEAVGKEWMETYWKQIDWALKPDTGVGVVQGITIPEARFDTYMRDTDFIRKWVGSPVHIFPGGFLPTVTFLVDTLTRGSGGRLVTESMDNIGPHYARTLKEWRRRFEDKFEEEILPALKEEYPLVMGHEVEGAEEAIEVFKRKWVYYFCYCEVGFASRRLGDHIITFTREGNVGYGCPAVEWEEEEGCAPEVTE